jgi:epoxyqueuosine reductase
MELKQQIKARALDEGFECFAVADPAAIGHAPAALAAYLNAGHHGDMAWMAETATRRGDPRILWPKVRSIIMLGVNYGPASNPLASLNKTRCGTISVYARARDYHDVIKKRLKKTARWLAEAHDAQVKVFVDTAPVMEKPLAEASGLGWQGKHTNLVSHKFGSWLFLGSIFTDLALPPDDPGEDSCGTCRACLDICPTRAFPAPYKIDARRCISYLTIEHKGHIPAEFLPLIGNRIYGCDDCLAVCPWNKFASTAREQAFHARPELDGPLLAELAALDDAAFRALFSASPVKRIGRDRFVRNVLIAIGNSRAPELAAVAAALLDDLSPLVRAMAVWALGRLAPDGEWRKAAAAALSRESDPQVRGHWQDVLAAAG